MLEFPKKAVESKLREWYKKKSDSPLRKKRVIKQIESGTVFDIQPEISSIETVSVLREVEPLIKLELENDGSLNLSKNFKLNRKGSLIKQGGYRSSDEFIADMLPRLEARYNEFMKIARGIPNIKGAVRANVS